MKLKPYLQSLGCAVMLLLAASCTDDALDNGANNGQSPEADSNVVTLTVLDGASQQGRIHTPAAPDTRALKSQRLQYVATIDNELWQNESKVWSATSVYIDDATKRAYITWHSDRQASNPAQMWGGALDVIDINNEDKPSLQNGMSLVSEKELKFNNVTLHEGNIFLSAMHPRKGGVVARVNLGNPSQADLIGFPGSSVNAIAPNSDGKLMVVSGFKGTYGTVSPMQPAIEYDYDNPKSDNNAYLGLEQEMNKDFGGKYVAVDEGGRAYILRQNGDKGEIIDVKGDNTIPMSVPLLSEEKYAEDYDPATENWVTEGTRRSEYFGKHVMVIRNGYAYVAAGKSGIFKYNLMDGKETKINGIFATGLYADEEFLYAATGSGLRIYKFNDETGDLPLYAFEVETYDEVETGAPTSTTAATTGSKAPKRHSPNFVTAHRTDKGIYIYIAYGQSGVRVYKFKKEGEEQPEDPDDHPYVDPGDDSDIVWATENVEGYYAWGEIFHAASGENTLEQFEADPEGTTFTSPDGITVVCNDEYWPYSTESNKTSYTFDNYRYCDMSSVHQEKFTHVRDNKIIEGPFINMSKYNMSEAGEAEDKYTLDPEDDVATMRWGNGWRMPTAQEWLDMMLKFCGRDNISEGTRVDANGIERTGMIFKFPNGEELFIPETGYYTSYGGKWALGNHRYHYWTSTLSDQKLDVSPSHENSNYFRKTGSWIYENFGTGGKAAWSYEALAYMVYWEYDSDPMYSVYTIDGYDRAMGFKVRPVKDKKNMPNDFPEWQDKQ